MRKLLTRTLLAALLASGTGVFTTRAAVYAEAGGIVTVEAEHPDSRTAEEADPFHAWTIIPTEDPGPDTFANARGGQYLQTLPNSGANNNLETSWSNRPWADYLVQINTPGLYRMYLRWNGYTGNNSMYAEIVELKDGPGGAIADWYRWGIADTVTPFDDFNRGWDGSAGFELVSGDSGDVPATWNLSRGVYTVRLHMREDGGAADAFVLQLNSLPAPTNPGPAESAVATSFVRITRQPLDTAISEGSAATFTVEATGSGPVTYQWQRAPAGSSTFTDIAGATSATYTTGNLTSADTGTQYRVNVSVPGYTLASAVAKVNLDQVPPAVIGALGGGDRASVTIRFNEKVTQATAETLANYTISGLTLSNPKLQANGTDVLLTTTAQSTNVPYVITINGIKDLAGNTATGLQARFAGATYQPGGVLQKFWNSINVNTPDTLRTDPRFPNNPSFVTIEPRFEYPANAGGEAGSNYGNTMSGWIVPPVTGDYVFFVCSDDLSDLFLSTDEDPAHKKLIAQETQWSNARQWVTSGGPSDVPSKRSDQFPNSEWTTPNVITLTAGRLYYIEVQHTEGTGGDNVGVQWQKPGDPEPVDGSAPIDGSFVRILADPTASVNFTQQPTNISVQASTPAAFTVAFNAFSAFGTNATVQWQRAPAGSTTFTNIPGATGATFSIPFAAPTDTGAQFRAVVTASATSVNSSTATLTVTGETTPPQLTGVSADTQKILVSFNEPLDPVSVTAGAFTATGATISGATVVSAAGQAGAVRLNATGLTAGQQYTLNVTGVKDLSGNAVAAGTSRTFTVYNISENFGSGVPAGAGISGSANVLPTGELELTRNVGSLQGSLTFPDVLNGGTANKLTATFKLFIGNGSGNPADGFSFNVASDLMPDPTAPPNYGEEGAGGGLTVAFDTYDNGGGEAPAISLKFAGNEFATTNLAKATLVNNRWVDVVIKVDADGTIDVQHDNVKYFDNFPVQGWAPISAPQVGVGARTGGEFETHRVDDLNVLFNADVVLPQPPTVTITAPTANQAFPVGASITISANATDPENQVAKVEFFVNGVKVGEDTTAPYSFTIPNAAQSVYNVSARVTDAQGLAVSSAAVRAIVGTPEKVYLVTADPGPLTFPGDQAIYDHLSNRGFDVVIARGSDVPDDGSTALGSVLIIETSTLGSGTVEISPDPAGGTVPASKFKNLAIPAMEWEASSIDAFGFAAANGVTVTGSDINIVDASTPLTGSLPAGLTTVVTSPQTLSVGAPAGGSPVGAHIVATTTNPAEPVLYYYDKGEKGFENFTMPERRVFFFFQDNTAAAANDNGWKIFDATVDWLLHRQATTRPTATVTRGANNTLTIASDSGGTVQGSDSLSPVNWTDIGPAPQTVNTSGRMKFFRIRK
jgi:hypothetical protein